MKFAFIFIICIVVAFFVFAYISIKKTVDTTRQESIKYSQEQDKQVETQSQNYIQDLDSVKKNTNDAYKNIEQ
jgi:hypothetical protein